MHKIREGTKEDVFAIRHVVTLAWNETYKGIVPDWFLDSLSKTEKEKAQHNYDNYDSKEEKYYVLEVDGNIVGFSKYGKSNDPELINYGEIIALYILKKYQGNGYGKELVNVTFDKLKSMGFNKVIIACLKENPTNEFYKHIGGKYLKNSEFSLLHLEENVYLFEI